MERRNSELDAENKVLKQTVYTSDNRIRELEGRLAFFIKQNEDLKNLLRTSDKVFINISSSLSFSLFRLVY